MSWVAVTAIRRLGGTCGDGRQFMSRVHGDDLVRDVEWLLASQQQRAALRRALAAYHIYVR